ncbi:hypothetical protein BDR05DRAFT_998782 [Suillus weaverae]|nr:hypothetical protein BDR05DRAFT_998782 [Suillus weaverae]
MPHSNFGDQKWVSHRATQASHPGFHILQDNLANILALLLKSFSAIKSQVLELRTWNSELRTQNSELGMLHSNFGGQKWVSHRATQALHPRFHILQDNLANILALLLRIFSAIKSWVPELRTRNSELGMLHSNFGGQKWVSRRATQASHPGFHILQDNLRAVKDHVKRAPAALFSKIPTLVGHLTWTVLTELC